MTPVTCFEGKHAAVFGLGGSGFVTAQALVAAAINTHMEIIGSHLRAKSIMFPVVGAGLCARP